MRECDSLARVVDDVDPCPCCDGYACSDTCACRDLDDAEIELLARYVDEMGDEHEGTERCPRCGCEVEIDAHKYGCPHEESQSDTGNVIEITALRPKRQKTPATARSVKAQHVVGGASVQSDMWGVR